MVAAPSNEASTSSSDVKPAANTETSETPKVAEESVTAPENVSALTEEVASPQSEKTEEPIADQTIRIHVKSYQKKTRKLRDSGPGMMLKNHRKTGRQVPNPLRMQRQMTTAII